jgi:prophage maintenance system killer protein
MKKKEINSGVVIYQTKSGSIELKGDYKKETIWATQAQIANLFNVTPQNVTLHLNNIFKDEELNMKATCKESLQVQIEGKREIKRTVRLYNLDAIIAVGYRINSVVGTNFRIWATKVLKSYITQGYVINRAKVANNYDEFMKVVGDIQNLLPEHVNLDPKAVLDLIREFASTWVSLDAYDKEELKPVGHTKKTIKLAGEELLSVILDLKKELMKNGEATDIFAQERSSGSVAGIVGNVMQSFGGKPLYETVEEKAAHLLYFMVKNHPFVDGNKRSGAFAFIWFLRKTKLRSSRKIDPNTLTALTLLVAESDPSKKDVMVGLISQILK